MSADHDRTFIRSFLIVLGILFGITFAILFAARLIMAQADPDEYSEAKAQRVVERTEPVYTVVTDPKQVQQVSQSSGSDAGGSDSGSKSPEQVYQSVCATCHKTGVSGAPKLSNNSAWKPRIAKGKDTLYKHAIDGFNAMPAKGGRSSLSDKKVKATVDYMVEQTGS